MPSYYKGVNIGGWFSQLDAIQEKDPSEFSGIDSHIKTFIAGDDIELIKKAGFNHIRLPIDYQNFFDEDGNLAFPQRLDYCELMVNKIVNSGLIVFLDLHECPGHDFDDAVHAAQEFFINSKKREATKNVWSELCTRFGNNPSIFLELLNEPAAPSDAQWNDVKKELYDFVRGKAQESTIVLGSNNWNCPASYKNLSLINDGNVVYCFHFYSPLLFTHQKAPWLKDENAHQSRPYPGDYSINTHNLNDERLLGETGIWNKNRLKTELKPVLEFRDRHKVPVICNEFGVFHQAPRKSQIQWLEDFLSILKSYEIGFSYWNYKNLDFGLISKGESLHANLPQFSNSESLDKELLKLLAGF